MSPACSQALRLPEIVAAILEQLKDEKALFAALQVNKLWADEATTLLWRVRPQTLDLARIQDAERLQYYADKVSFLNIRLDKDQCESHLELQNVLFPRLKELSMDICGCENEQIFLKYLQPHLRKISIHKGPVSDYYLMQIQARCPALRQLDLCHVSGTITANGLIDFLSGMHSLAAIHLWGSLEDVNSDEVYIHLASRPNLAALTTGDDKVLTLSLIKRIQEVIDQPFPKLVSLICFLESNAFAQFGRHLIGLTDLNLHLVDAASKTIFDICSCTNLVSLALNFYDSHFDANSHLPPDGLLALAKSCSHLQIFKATADRVLEADGDSTANITDDTIREFVALLPGLTCLKLNIKTNLTHRALRFLGEGCAGLKECCLDGRSFDLQLLGGGGPVLFRHLEELALEPVEDCVSATMVAEILHHHAPRLNDLMLGGSGGRFVKEVGDKMREFKREGEAWYFRQLSW